MAATREEAANIVAVLLQYMPIKVAQHIVLDVEKEVGNITRNESLRETVTLLKYFLNADNIKCGEKCDCKENWEWNDE